MDNRIRLFNGDCLEVMKEIPSKSVDMILCDLPYGTTQNKWDSIIPLNDYIDIENKRYIQEKNRYKRMSYDEYKDYCIFELGITNIDKIYNSWNEQHKQGLWTQYCRIIKDNGAIVLFAQTPFDKILGYSNLKMLKYEWIWEKTAATGHLNAKKMPMKAHENILVFYKKLPIYNPQKTTGHTPVHSYTKYQDDGSNYGKTSVGISGGGSTERYPRSVQVFKTDKQKESLHPTQKPVSMLEYLIKTYTNEGETVLDNTMGSGSTGVAAINTGRKFIGIELDLDYYNIAKNRIDKALEEKAQ